LILKNKVKMNMNNNYQPLNSEPTITVAFVGHCKKSTVKEIKELLAMIPDFYEVHFEISVGKLWIKKDDRP